MKKGTLTTIEITDTHVKWIQARMLRNAPLINACVITDLQDATDAHASSVVSQIVSLKETEADNVFAVLPRRFAILKQLSLPSQDEAEIQKMIGLQLVNQIPFSREEIIYDYQLLGKEADGYTKVLVVIVHKDVVNRYLSIYDKAGCHPQKFLLGSFGILEWFLLQESPDKMHATTALVNVDESSSEICFFRQNKLLFSRNINFGNKDLNEGPTTFIEQVGLTFGAYKKEGMGEDFQRIVIAAAGKGAGLLKEKMQEYYKVPVDILSPVNDLPCEKNLDSKAFRAEDGISVAANLGFLLGDLEHQINLMPFDVLDTKRLRKQRKALLKFASAFLVTLVLGIGAMGVGIYHDSTFLKELDAQVETTKTQVQRAEKKIRFLRFARETIQNRIFIVDVIQELYALTPEKISFRSLQLDQKGALIMQGFADTSASVSDFQGELVRSTLFKDVTLQYATKRKKFREEYTEFKILCSLAMRKELEP